MSEVPLYGVLMPNGGAGQYMQLCWMVGRVVVPGLGFRGTSLIRNSPPSYNHPRARGIVPDGGSWPGLKGYLAHKKQPPPESHHRALGIFLLYGPRGVLFLMSEIPLYGVLMPDGGAGSYMSKYRTVVPGLGYRGTSLIRNITPVGSTVALGLGTEVIPGGGCFLRARYL